MGWTYSGDPSASDLDEIRYLLGDTDTTDQLVTDEEIVYALSLFAKEVGIPNFQAAAFIAGGLASKYVRLIDKTVGSLSLKLSTRAEGFRTLADWLTAQATSGIGHRTAGVPRLGGGGTKHLGSNTWSPERAS